MLDALQAELDAVAARRDARASSSSPRAGKAFCAGHDLKEMRAAPSLAYYEALFAQCARDDADDPAPAGAGDRARPGHRHGGRLPAGRGVRPRGRRRAARASRSAASTSACSARRRASRCRATWRARRRSRCSSPATSSRAEEARAKGLVNRVAAPEALDAEVESLVAAIVAKPRVAIALGKQLFYRQIETRRRGRLRGRRPGRWPAT